jgi:predicted ATPase
MAESPTKRRGAGGVSGAATARIAEPLTSFVGREGELAFLRECFDGGRRLVTITGPGGIGKTRLALRFAAMAASPTTALGEVCFIDLTEAASTHDVLSSVSRTLGVVLAASGDDRISLAHLARTLAARPATLLVLDNVEQVVAEAALVVAAVLEATSAVRVLATSRERLRLAAEQVVNLGPLAVPRLGEDNPEQYPSVRLFFERARSVSPGWAEGRDDLSTVSAMARLLDGFPLAIELCATRGRVLDPAALLARLQRGFDVVSAGPRDAPERHRTLLGVIDWSFDLLSVAEQKAFAGAAVFAGGFTLEAAEAILDLGAGEPRVLDVLEALVDKSLLRAGSGRFSMYSAIRDHAARTLANSGAQGDTEARHARYFLDWAERLVRDGLDGSGRARLSIERDNLAAVHARMLAAGGVASAESALRAALVLDDLLDVSGPSLDVFDALDAALGMADGAAVSPQLVARALEARGRGHRIAGRTNDAKRDLERAIEIAKRSRDGVTETRAWTSRCVTLVMARQSDQAIDAGQRAVASSRAIGAARLEGRALCALAGAHIGPAHLDRATALLADSEAIARRVGDRWTEAMASTYRGHLLQDQGALSDAVLAYDRAIALFEDTGDVRRAAMMTGYRATAQHEEGDRQAACEAYAHAAEQLARCGNPRFEALFRACLGAARAELGQHAEARAAFASAEAAMGHIVDATLRLVLELHRLHLEVAEQGRTSEALAHARALAEQSPVAASSDDVRFALRMLHRAIERVGHDAASTVALRVALTSRWFELPGGRRTPLGRKKSLWLVLHALVDARLRGPGSVLSPESLVTAGWPGERVLPSAGRQRVRVAITTLRNSGLREVLLSRDGGYLLDPIARVELIAD